MKVFKEQQRFTQLWLHIIITLTTIVTFIVIIKEWMQVTDKSIAENLPSLFTIVILLLIHTLVYIAKLNTKIDENGIHYQFFPFHVSIKTIPWNKIKEAYVRTYLPITEFGGWGLRGGFFFNKGKEKAINVSGDIGIQLVLKNGEKLLIGTQKKEEAKRVLKTYKK